MATAGRRYWDAETKIAIVSYEAATDSPWLSARDSLLELGPEGAAILAHYWQATLDRRVPASTEGWPRNSADWKEGNGYWRGIRALAAPIRDDEGWDGPVDGVAWLNYWKISHPTGADRTIREYAESKLNAKSLLWTELRELNPDVIVFTGSELAKPAQAYLRKAEGHWNGIRIAATPREVGKHTVAFTERDSEVKVFATQHLSWWARGHTPDFGPVARRIWSDIRK